MINSTSCRDGGGGESQPGLPRIDSNTANDRDSIHIYVVVTRVSWLCSPKIATMEHRVNRMNRIGWFCWGLCRCLDNVDI